MFPTYYIVSTKFGYGNGKNRISTYAFEIRCAPDDAVPLKKLLTRISLSSTNDIKFIPTGMLQMLGQTAYKNALKSQN